jgi:hypothetical protein
VEVVVKEGEYVLAQDLTRLRIAYDVLGEITCDDVDLGATLEILQAQIKHIYKRIVDLS